MAEYSPMMQHYINMKEEYKDCILFYRLGDFYEMFFDDAIEVSRELELTLTGKECGMEERAPMCGIPYHAANVYIAKLIEKGYKVAICEQLEDPKNTKGMVKRGVVKIVTPGTVLDETVLDEKKNNYIMSIYKQGLFFGLAVCDVSTGDFYATQIKETNNFAKLLDEIARYSPVEIVTNDLMSSTMEEMAKISQRFENCYISKYEEKYFDIDIEKIKSKHQILDMKDNEITEYKDKLLLVSAVNALLTYITQMQKMEIENINAIRIYNTTRYMALDITARRNLEITERMKDKSKKGTLLWVLDRTLTSMGGRHLRRWINDPLIDIEEIHNRLGAVKELKEDLILKADIGENLKKVYDIERLVGKIAYGSANARDMVSLKNSLGKLPEIKQILSTTKSTMLKNLYENLDEVKEIYELIEKAIVDDPPIVIKEGNIIKNSYNAEVDKYKEATTNGKKWLVELEAKEREKTGIKNLRISYNKVFGYYIEVTKSYLNLVPENYTRKQTLSTGERYITEELKKLEEDILGAEEKLVELEYNLFIEVRNKIALQIDRIQKSANIIATLDVLTAFATIAEDMNYTMPEVNDGAEIIINNGRHPVIEKMLPRGNFIGNDTYLNKTSDRLSIITGPNMAGKSTYMRQVALITLMAQIGSFVPADEAKIGVVDKIFTRVGASDDLSMGESTFMVEMMEVANILKDATSNSLIILDEIGRGTSTYDGLSIAWAVAKYISDTEKCGAKTLFATHYHELIELENEQEGVKNYSIAVKEKGEDIIFLRKIVEGGTDESYGIHVAKLAGVPKEVLKNANEILKSLERKSMLGQKKMEKEKKDEVAGQLSMYNYKIAEIAHEIDKINVEELTPIEALNILVKLKEQAS
ncbi:MAG: DNA mismatch repair protein MutS [Clostridia bacterium]|nr:DNA mismatch repair protein MutS [Clostridia bacterium]